MQNSRVTSFVDRRLAISSPPGAPKPKLLDRVRQAIRTRHYSSKTEEAYVGWIRRFIVFHNKRHPSDFFTTKSWRRRLAWSRGSFAPKDPTGCLSCLRKRK